MFYRHSNRPSLGRKVDPKHSLPFGVSLGGWTEVMYTVHAAHIGLPATKEMTCVKSSQFEAEQQLGDTVNRDTFCFTNALQSNRRGSRRAVDRTLNQMARIIVLTGRSRGA